MKEAFSIRELRSQRSSARPTKKHRRVELFLVSGRPFFAGAALIAASLVIGRECGRRVTARVPIPPLLSAGGMDETGVGEPGMAFLTTTTNLFRETFDMQRSHRGDRTLPFNTWLSR